MSMLSSEAVCLCLSGTAVLGCLVLCRCKYSRPLQSWMLCLAGIWGGACLLSLPFFWSLILFSLSCFLLHTCTADEELLPADGKAVLVTGSDTGFGHGLAKHLDKLGFTVFAGVLDKKSAGAKELQKSCSSRLSVLQMDITKPEQIKDAYSKVVEKMQDKGSVPLMKMAAYNSTKAALTMFSSILRQELSKWGVKVIIIQPGGFRTNITGTSDVWDKMEKNILENLPQEVQEDYGQDYILRQRNFLKFMHMKTSPDLTPVLEAVQHAISAQNPSPFYAPGKLTYLWVCFASVSPTILLDYIIQKLFGRGQDMPRALSMSS
ncbi:estradiol 17-beta-dehydrogenase 2-like isoform X2 [Dipodomys merriami]|uniref:estradiol 17-beta-dehydrogenase 2-like isoform X2 n=1 Tax=Dipodomys merriami TaxID=94247 RepID=UPI00384B22C2